MTDFPVDETSTSFDQTPKGGWRAAMRETFSRLGDKLENFIIRGDLHLMAGLANLGMGGMLHDPVFIGLGVYMTMRGLHIAQRYNNRRNPPSFNLHLHHHAPG